MRSFIPSWWFSHVGFCVCELCISMGINFDWFYFCIRIECISSNFTCRFIWSTIDVEFWAVLWALLTVFYHFAIAINGTSVLIVWSISLFLIHAEFCSHGLPNGTDSLGVFWVDTWVYYLSSSLFFTLFHEAIKGQINRMHSLTLPLTFLGFLLFRFDDVFL